MKRLSFPVVLMIFMIVNLCKAQNVGDYRSKADGNWNTLATWERFTAGAWVQPNALQGYPGQNASLPINIVTIREADDVTLNVTPAFSLANLVLDGDTGDGNGADLLTSGNPSLIIDGNLTLGNVLAGVTFSGSGNLTVGGNLSIGTLISFLFFSSTGNLTVTGSTSIAAGGFFTDSNNTGITTLVGSVTTSDLGFFISTAVTTNGRLVFNGGLNTSTLAFFTAGAATFNTNSQTISGAGTTNFANTVTVTGVTVTNNGIVTMSNSGAGTLTGTGIWTQNTGRLNYAGSTNTVTTFNASATGNIVDYNGSVAQTIRNPTTSTYYDLITDNSFGTSPQLTLTANTIVSNQLTMSDGNINLGANTLTLGTAIATPGTLSHAGAETNGYLYNGTFIRYINTTAITIGDAEGFFPMGASVDFFRPFFVGKDNIASSGGTISVSHAYDVNTNNVSFSDGASTVVRKNESYWTVAKSAGMTAGTWDLRAGGTGFGTIGNLADIRLTLTGSAPNPPSSPNIGTSAAATGSTSDPRANRTGMTTVAGLDNNFYLASVDGTSSPLPIVLSYFKANLVNDYVIAEWKTVQEINNDFFTIEKTSDFETFHEVGSIEGQGNSHESRIYSFVDDSPFIGKSYYRLKQTDFDGKFTFSDPVMINYDGPSALILKAYPNPFDGHQLKIELNGLKDNPDVPIVIYNLQGQKVYEAILRETGPGVIDEELYFNTSLPKGLYIVKAGKTLQLTHKVAVH